MMKKNEPGTCGKERPEIAVEDFRGNVRKRVGEKRLKMKKEGQQGCDAPH